MQTKKILYGIFLGSILAFTHCATNEEGPEVTAGGDPAALRPDQKKLAGIQTGTIRQRLLSRVIACTGEIEVPPQGMASVTAPMGGYIVETTMVPGTPVKKGQLLARLSNPEYLVLQQSYLEAAGQLKYAGQEFARQKSLQEQNATAVKKLQESESAYAVLTARLAGLKAQLNMIGINMKDLDEGVIQPVVALRAPMTGFVTAVNHHPGEFVEPREAIFEIVNMDHLHLHLNVFEQDIAQVKKDQEIRFRPTGSDRQRYAAKVLLVSPKRNEEVRAFDVHGHIESGEEQLKPGMYVEAEILISSDSVPALPENALVYRDNKAFVVVEENSQYRLEEATTGVKMDGWVEIIHGEPLAGKTIVTRGASRLYAAMEKKD